MVGRHLRLYQLRCHVGWGAIHVRHSILRRRWRDLVFLSLSGRILGIRPRLLVGVSILVLILLSTTAGQDCPSCVSSNVWRPTPVPLAMSSKSLTIRLEQAGPSTNWVIGVVAGNDAQAKVGEISFASNGGRPVPQSLKNWPAEAIRVETDNLVIRNLASLNGSLILFVTVPQATTISTLINGEKHMIGRLDSRLTIVNGRVLANAAASIGELLAIAQTTLTNIVESSGLMEESPGRYIASRKELRSHLLSFSRPESPLRDGKHHVVHLRFAVDEAGIVPKAVVMEGDEPFASACITKMQLWRFEPFENNGKLVRINGFVIFSFLPNGTVKSSMLD